MFYRCFTDDIEDPCADRTDNVICKYHVSCVKIKGNVSNKQNYYLSATVLFSAVQASFSFFTQILFRLMCNFVIIFHISSSFGVFERLCFTNVDLS